MNNITTRLDQSNIFYELDNLVLFGEHTEIEMDFLTPEGKVDHAASKIFNEAPKHLSYEELMDSWTSNAKESSASSKGSSYEELLDFVNFDSTPSKGKILDEETLPSKGLKDKVTESPAPAIAGTSLLVSSIFFVILAILCPHSSPALFAFYTALSTTATVSGGALLASTLIDKKHLFDSCIPTPKEVF